MRMCVLQQDQHGLGYDPFHGAEDFRSLKAQRQRDRAEEQRAASAAATSKLGLGGGSAGAGARGAGGKRPRGVAFGGVADDSGMYG